MVHDLKLIVALLPHHPVIRAIVSNVEHLVEDVVGLNLPRLRVLV